MNEFYKQTLKFNDSIMDEFSSRDELKTLQGKEIVLFKKYCEISKRESWYSQIFDNEPNGLNGDTIMTPFFASMPVDEVVKIISERNPQHKIIVRG